MRVAISEGRTHSVEEIDLNEFRRILLVGGTGTGKTTKAKDIVRKAVRSGMGVIAISLNDEFRDLSGELGLDYVEVKDMGLEPDTFKRNSVLTLQGFFGDDLTKAGFLILEILRHKMLDMRDVVVVIDDADRFLNPSAWTELMGITRKTGNILVTTVQAPTRLGNKAHEILSQADAVFIFRMNDSADLMILRDVLRLDKDDVKDILTLPLGESVLVKNHS